MLNYKYKLSHNTLIRIQKDDSSLNKKDILNIIKALAFERAPSGMEKARGEIFKKEIEKFCPI